MDQTMIQALTAAVPRRHSVRAYLPQALPEETRDALEKFIREMEVPFERRTELRLFRAQPGKKLFNNGINGVDNLVLLGETDLVSVSKAGFCGELAALKMVSLGLSTCWFGHYKLAELAKCVDEGLAVPQRLKESNFGYGYGKIVDGGERAICCIACGEADPSVRRLVDVVAGKNGAGRKPLESLLEEPADLAALPAGVFRALELARLAPSAANSQMWRFGIREGGRVITVAKPVGYKHFKWEHPDVDVGACAAHLWLGLASEGLAPKVTVRQDADRAMWTFVL